VTAAGVSLAALVSARDSSIVVIYDPGDCFSCDALMPLLQDWAEAQELEGNEDDIRLAVVLTRRPSQEERDQLTLLWIWDDNVIGSDRVARLVGRAYRPEMVLFVDGQEVASEPYDPSLSPAVRGPIVEYVLRTLDQGRTPDGSVQPTSTAALEVPHA